jgi:hypothetical protein
MDAELPDTARLIEVGEPSGLGRVTTHGQFRCNISWLKVQAAQPAPVHDLEAEAKRSAAQATPPSVNTQSGRFEVRVPESAVGPPGVAVARRNDCGVDEYRTPGQERVARRQLAKLEKRGTIVRLDFCNAVPGRPRLKWTRREWI